MGTWPAAPWIVGWGAAPLRSLACIPQELRPTQCGIGASFVRPCLFAGRADPLFTLWVRETRVAARGSEREEALR